MLFKALVPWLLGIAAFNATSVARFNSDNGFESSSVEMAGRRKRGISSMTLDVRTIYFYGINLDYINVNVLLKFFFFTSLSIIKWPPLLLTIRLPRRPKFLSSFSWPESCKLKKPFAPTPSSSSYFSTFKKLFPASGVIIAALNYTKSAFEATYQIFFSPSFSTDP